MVEYMVATTAVVIVVLVVQDQALPNYPNLTHHLPYAPSPPCTTTTHPVLHRIHHGYVHRRQSKHRWASTRS